MHVIAELSVTPIGNDISVSDHIAACERVLQDSGLTFQLHGTGTNIEGEWDRVLTAVRTCHDVMHDMGAERINTTLRIDTRKGRTESLNERVQSVQSKLSGSSAAAPG